MADSDATAQERPTIETPGWNWDCQSPEVAQEDWSWELPPAPEPPIVVGLVAAKNPVSALIVTVESLFAGGATRVVVVDDGSDDPESLEVFNDAELHGAEVIHLARNMGKSKALRAGFISLQQHYDRSFIIAQVDDDTYAGDLAVPVKMITDGKADIVDVRVETFPGTNLISNVQQLDYWLINATIKRLQDWVRARLWLSGASVLYTSEAAQVMLMQDNLTQTEDTEGRFRAIGAGVRVRYCSSKKSQFKTMVPESLSGMRHQWKRWALGNGQVLGIHGFGGGNPRIALVNLLSWVILLVGPMIQFMLRDLVPIPYQLIPGDEYISQVQNSIPQIPYVTSLLTAVLWMVIFGLVVGVIGAIQLRRLPLVVVGVFIPLLSLFWTYHAIEGLARAIKQPHATSLTWTPPKRMETKELVDAGIGQEF